MLYITLGFRQFSHHFTGIRDVLGNGRRSPRPRASGRLAADAGCGDLPRSRWCATSSNIPVLAAHRHMFGVLAWTSVLAALGLGPHGCGALPHGRVRLALLGRPGMKPCSAPARHYARLPPRPGPPSTGCLPPDGAVLCRGGQLREAIEGWRFHAQRFPNDNDGVIRAATSGAINVRPGWRALKGAHAAAVHPRLPGGCGHRRKHPGREAGWATCAAWWAWCGLSVVVWMLLALLTAGEPAGVKAARRWGQYRVCDGSANRSL